MIKEYDLEKRIIKDNIINYNKDTKMILTEDGKDLISLKDFTNEIRKKEGCYFECICYCHATLDYTYRCKTCGCVIFSGDDERYDPNLKCPVCTDYKPKCEYWTKEEIDSDIEKQNTIKGLIDYQQYMDESDARYKKRGNKYDWEIFKKTIKVLNKLIGIKLECDNITKSYIKGLQLKIKIFKLNNNGYHEFKKEYVIPLSISSFKNQKRSNKLLKEKEETKT